MSIERVIEEAIKAWSDNDFIEVIQAASLAEFIARRLSAYGYSLEREGSKWNF